MQAPFMGVSHLFGEKADSVLEHFKAVVFKLFKWKTNPQDPLSKNFNKLAMFKYV